MQWRCWAGWLVLIVAVSWSIPGVAQPDEDAGEQTATESDQAADEVDEADADAEVDEDDEPAAGDDEETDSAEATTESEEDEALEEAEDEPVEGPGGEPLDTSYPGTDDALQADMETGELEGLDVPDGEDPEEVYDLRVRELETQLDDLQERVFRSKSRIALLRETVLAENLAGSRAVITFQDDLGSAYAIDRAVFSVDGSQVFSEVEPNGELDDEGIEVFSGPVAPGTHTVSVTLGLRGSGYGVFSYAEGYEFDLRFSCQFTAEEGRTTLVTVQSYESGNMFTAHEDRPDGLCEVSMVELTVEDLEDEEAEEFEGDIEDDLPDLD